MSERELISYIEKYTKCIKDKKKLISGIADKLTFICYNMENRNWDNIDKLIEELKEKLK